MLALKLKMEWWVKTDMILFVLFSVRVAEYNAAIDARNEELAAALKETSERISNSTEEESTVGDTKSGIL